MRETNRKDRTEERKPRSRDLNGRVPLGQLRSKLYVDPSTLDPNYHYRIINDNGARLMQAEKAGYSFVTGSSEGTDIGDRVSWVVGTKPDGSGPMRAYLMKLPMEFREEDLQDKRKQINEFDNQIKRTLKGEGMEKTYIPDNSSPGSYQP